MRLKMSRFYNNVAIMQFIGVAGTGSLCKILAYAKQNALPRGEIYNKAC
jgi:hypothetical protein